MNLREGDYAFLQDYYAAEGASAASIVRLLTASHVDKLRKEQTAGLSKEQINVENL